MVLRTLGLFTDVYTCYLDNFNVVEVYDNFRDYVNSGELYDI